MSFQFGFRRKIVLERPVGDHRISVGETQHHDKEINSGDRLDRRGPRGGHHGSKFWSKIIIVAPHFFICSSYWRVIIFFTFPRRVFSHYFVSCRNHIASLIFIFSWLHFFTSISLLVITYHYFCFSFIITYLFSVSHFIITSLHFCLSFLYGIF